MREDGDAGGRAAVSTSMVLSGNLHCSELIPIKDHTHTRSKVRLPPLTAYLCQAGDLFPQLVY